jgi:hypothetical protein
LIGRAEKREKTAAYAYESTIIPSYATFYNQEVAMSTSAGIVLKKNKTRKNEIFTENKNEKKREKNEI